MNQLCMHLKQFLHNIKNITLINFYILFHLYQTINLLILILIENLIINSNLKLDIKLNFYSSSKKSNLFEFNFLQYINH